MQIGGVSFGYGMVSSAYSAVSRGTETVDRAAENIANGSILENDLGVEDIVALKEGEIQSQAGAKALDVYQKTLGSLLDIEV